jgi:hypothetical protein
MDLLETQLLLSCEHEKILADAGGIGQNAQ